MNFLPKELEDIIIYYKNKFEHLDKVKQHNKKFKKSLIVIKKLINISFFLNEMSGQFTEKTVTIGPLTYKNPIYIYCYCFRVCLLCHNIIASSRMEQNYIGSSCKCY